MSQWPSCPKLRVDDRPPEVAHAGGELVRARNRSPNQPRWAEAGIWVGANSASRVKTLIDRLTLFESAYVLISRPSPTITSEASEPTR
jgi:hypothetical protein